MIARTLYRLTAALPCRLIHRGDGSRYLERYAMPGPLRRLLARIGVTVYVHRFVGRDADQWVHDHPWRWACALLLTGGYMEDRLRWWEPGRLLTDVRRIGGWRRLNLLGPRSFHRITATQPETWTLFVHGPRCKGWGFVSVRYQLSLAGPGALGETLTYHQPHNTAANAGWEHRAPLGRDAERAPMEDA